MKRGGGGKTPARGERGNARCANSGLEKIRSTNRSQLAGPPGSYLIPFQTPTARSIEVGVSPRLDGQPALALQPL